jgi:hypothetical protein
VEKETDDFIEASTFYNRVCAEKIELEKLEKENDETEALKEIAEKKVEIEGRIRKCEEVKELTELNRDAFAHQQEHLNKFFYTYVSVSFLVVIVELSLYLNCDCIVGYWDFPHIDYFFFGRSLRRSLCFHRGIHDLHRSQRKDS